MERKKTNIARAREMPRPQRTRKLPRRNRLRRQVYSAMASCRRQAEKAQRRLWSVWKPQEEEAHRRLVAALGRGNPLEIDAAQTFWAKVFGDIAET
jgi:hypothetical protein